MVSATTRADSVRLAPDDPMIDRGGGGVAALETVQVAVDGLLAEFLLAQVEDLRNLDPALENVGLEIERFVAGAGKRLRPAFVYWGYRATGAAHDDAVLHVAAAVELLHSFALIHDDIMDRSDWRRGRPALHRALAAAHAAERLLGDPRWFGVGGAILAGDLAFVWADRLFDEAPLPVEALARARRVFTQLRVEVMAGQYLDLRLAGLEAPSEDDAMRVALLKSGRYTVTRPLQVGAALGGRDQRLDATLATYGDTVGLAFQLRDDVLGLFGDPAVTGKGAVEDLREGKRTLLILRAMALAGTQERNELSRMLGNPDLDEADADRARDIVRTCGALDSVDAFLGEQRLHARACLAEVPQPARAALEQLADLVVSREV